MGAMYDLIYNNLLLKISKTRIDFIQFHTICVSLKIAYKPRLW